MRFCLDEHLSPRIAEIARGLGIDVTTVVEQGALGKTDDEQLSAAAANGRCFVTQDRADFIALTARYYAEGRPHAGLALIPSSLPADHFTGIARALAALAAEHVDDVLDYAILYLGLPVEGGE